MLLIVSQQMEGCEQVNTHNNKLLYFIQTCYQRSLMIFLKIGLGGKRIKKQEYKSFLIFTYLRKCILIIFHIYSEMYQFCLIFF